MQSASPTAFRAIVGADRIVTANREAIEKCSKAAARSRKAARCRRAARNRNHLTTTAAQGGGIGDRLSGSVGGRRRHRQLGHRGKRRGVDVDGERLSGCISGR